MLIYIFIDILQVLSRLWLAENGRLPNLRPILFQNILIYSMLVNIIEEICQLLRGFQLQR